MERLLLLRLPGRRQGRERPAVERAVHGHDVVALLAAARLAVAPGELDRALVRLRARVREEHASAPAEERVEPGGQPGLEVVVIEVGDVRERARLVGERIGDGGMRVPDRRDGEPRQEVEVLAAFRVP